MPDSNVEAARHGYAAIARGDVDAIRDDPGRLRADVTTFRGGKAVEMVAYGSPDAAVGA